MYVGNLEFYQGVDLLLETFALASDRINEGTLVVIGGLDGEVNRYRSKAKDLGIDSQVQFLGPRRLSDLGTYLKQADILVSPRLHGSNTPMKIYSYLHSGRPVLATNIDSHTQILDSSVALLAPPSPGQFSSAMYRLMTDDALGVRLGKAAQKLVEKSYTFDVFRREVTSFFDTLETSLVENGQLRAIPNSGFRIP
jgi:glycosyltransferase involved in cell wall biosynthesis